MSIVKNLNAIIDKDEIMERVDGDIDLLIELMDLFIADYPKLLSNIKNAIIQENSGELKRSAHTIKGSVGNFSANSAYNIALSLEIMGQNNNFSNAEKTYIELEKEIDLLIQTFDILKRRILYDNSNC